MIAILIALGRNDAFEGIQEYLPVPLLPLGDKPFLQHGIEYLAGQGVRRFEFVLSHLPEKIEAALGDGARWGCSFHYHLLPSGGDALQVARAVAAKARETVVLGDAECVPDFKFRSDAPSTLITRDGARTGWGLFAPGDLELPDFDHLPRAQAERWISLASGREFLRSQRLLLDQSFPGLPVSGRQADPGIWISRNVSLHPTVRLHSPVYIGENCRVGKGAQLGPSAVIGANCIIDAQTIVVDSMVGAGTYVGEGLELDSVIVDRNRLLNIRLETSLLASETFLLGSLTERASSRVVYRMLSVLTAFLLLLVLWPLLVVATVYALLFPAGSLRSARAIQIPADDDPGNWKEAPVLHFRAGEGGGRFSMFLLVFLPGLISVLGGRLYLVGVQPRSRAQLMRLPSDWRALYLKTKAGLITEAAVMFGGNPTEDEVYSAEAFYSATESISHDCRLLGLWFWKLLSGFPSHEISPVKELP